MYIHDTLQYTVRGPDGLWLRASGPVYAYLDMLSSGDNVQSSCGSRNGHHILIWNVSSQTLSGDVKLTHGLAFERV